MLAVLAELERGIDLLEQGLALLVETIPAVAELEQSPVGLPGRGLPA